MNPSYIRYGGVARDCTDEFFEQLETFIEHLPVKIDEYETLLTKNEIFLARTKGIGMLPPEVCKAYSVTGPIARASGIDYDVRRAEPYGIYDRFDWTCPVRSTATPTTATWSGSTRCARARASCSRRST